MAKISHQTASRIEQTDGFEARMDDLDGYTVSFETYTEDADPAPLFAGLPDDRCQCPHWGVVLEGTLVYRYADGTEDVITAGEAYYAPPGHLPLFRAGCRLVEFSPQAELAATVETVMRNAEALESAS